MLYVLCLVICFNFIFALEFFLCPRSTGIPIPVFISLFDVHIWDSFLSPDSFPGFNLFPIVRRNLVRNIWCLIHNSFQLVHASFLWSPINCCFHIQFWLLNWSIRPLRALLVGICFKNSLHSPFFMSCDSFLAPLAVAFCSVFLFFSMVHSQCITNTIVTETSCQYPTSIVENAAGNVLFMGCVNGGVRSLAGSLVTSYGTCTRIVSVDTDVSTGTVYAACNYGDSHDQVLSLAGTTVSTILTASQCSQPSALAVDPSHHILFVACNNGGILSVAGSIITTVATSSQCPNPISLYFRSSTGVLYAACYGGGVISILGANVTTLATSLQCPRPNDVTVNQTTGVVYVACNSGGVLSISGSTVTTIASPSQCNNPVAVAVDPHRDAVYAACNYYQGIIAITGTWVSTIVPGQQCYLPVSLTVGRNNSLLYAICYATGGIMSITASNTLTQCCGTVGKVCSPVLNGAAACMNGTCTISCSAGYFASGSVCSLCSTGFFCPPGSVMQTPCLMGYYCPSSIYQYLCQLGTFCPQGSASQSSCPSGTFCPNTSISLACPSGTYCPPGSIAPVNCTRGNYCPLISSSPIPCTSGYFCSSEGLSLPNGLCPAGYFCPAGSTGPIACGSGFYCPSTGMSVGIPCPMGSFCPLQNGTAAVTCPLGSFCSVTSLSSPTGMCSPGQFCPAGSFSPQSCPLGHYCPTSGMSIPTACSAAYYCPYAGSAVLGPICPAGWFCSAPGLSAPESLCPAMTYCPAGSVHPIPCPSGSISPAGSPYCFPCPLGSVIQNNSCYPCPIGFFLDSQTAPGNSCFPCPLGTYTSGTGSTTCLDCPTGTFAPSSAWNSSCQSCPPGSFSLNSSRSSACNECPLGYFCPPGSHVGSIIACSSPSQYCPGNSTGARVTQAGYYADGCESDGSRCRLQTMCSVGSYCQGGVKHTCPIGQFTNTTGSIECMPCALGTVSPSLGQSVCDLCQAGTYTLHTGSVVCISCSPGTYQPFNGSSETSCTPCPFDTFSNRSASSSCTACPPGQVTPAQGSQVCTGCSPGQANIGLNHSCQDCPLGSYADRANLPQCFPCPSGHYTPQVASLLCIPCPAGKYANTSDWSFSECGECPSGTQSMFSSSSSFCVMCSPGSYSAVASSAVCSLCSPGTWNSEWGQTRCLPCPAGTFSSEFHSTTCLPCPKQHFSNVSSGAPSCELCPDSTFANDFSSACSPSSCPLGFGFNSALKRCDLCPPHTFSTGDSSACQFCPSNTYTVVWGSFFCLDCLSISGIDCPYGVVVIRKGFWPYLVFVEDSNSNNVVFFTNESIAFSVSNGAKLASLSAGGRLELQTTACPPGYCSGDVTVQLHSPSYLHSFEAGAICRSGACSILPQFYTTAPLTLNQSQIAFFSLSSSAALVQSTLAQNEWGCTQNRDSSSDNYLCGRCLDGFVEWRGSCVSCPHLQSAVLFGYIVFGFAYVSLIFRLSQRSRSDARILIYFVQVGLFQVGSADQYIRWLGLVNFDVFQSSGSSCFAPLTPYQKITLSLTIPLFCLVQLGLLLVIHMLWRIWKYASNDSGLRFTRWRHWVRRVETKLEKLGYEKKMEGSAAGHSQPASLPEVRSFAINVGFPFHKYCRAFLSILCFGYLQVTSVCIEYLNCVYVDGHRVLFASPQIDCDSSSYRENLSFIAILLAVEGCFFPVAMFGLLYCFRSRLHELKIKNYFGVLYEGYRESRCYWQPWILVRQVVLIGLATTFTSQYSYRFLAFCFYNVCVFSIHTLLMPNRRVIENHLESMSHLLLLLMTILLAPSSPPYSDAQQMIIFFLAIPFTLALCLEISVVRLPFKQSRRWVELWHLDQQVDENPGSPICSNQVPHNEAASLIPARLAAHSSVDELSTSLQFHPEGSLNDSRAHATYLNVSPPKSTRRHASTVELQTHEITSGRGSLSHQQVEEHRMSYSINPLSGIRGNN